MQATSTRDRGDNSLRQIWQAKLQTHAKTYCVSMPLSTKIMGPGFRKASGYPNKFLADFWPSAFVIGDVAVCSALAANMA